MARWKTLTFSAPSSYQKAVAEGYAQGAVGPCDASGPPGSDDLDLQELRKFAPT